MEEHEPKTLTPSAKQHMMISGITSDMLSQESLEAYFNSDSVDNEEKSKTLEYLNQLEDPLSESEKKIEAIKGLRPYFALCRLAALKKPATPKKPKWTTISRCAKDALNQAKKSTQTFMHPGPKK